jgi:excisionase family DNA binding protein
MNLDTTTEHGLPERATYTIQEAADILGLSRASAYRAAKRGQIPTLRIGRRILVGRQALINVLTTLAQPQTGNRTLKEQT